MVAKEQLEIWLPAPRYPHYKVSNLGRVKSVRILDGCITKYGYHRVNLYNKNNVFIHVLVCTAFHGPKPSSKHEVCHRDGNKLNNKASNLRWGTRKENIEDSVRLGTLALGSRHGMSKLTEDQVRKIRILSKDKSPNTYKGVAAQFNISITAVRYIVTKQRWAWLD